MKYLPRGPGEQFLNDKRGSGPKETVSYETQVSPKRLEEGMRRLHNSIVSIKLQLTMIMSLNYAPYSQQLWRIYTQFPILSMRTSPHAVFPRLWNNY